MDIIIFFGFFFFYFLPSVVGYARNAKRQNLVLLVNFLLGWTGIGWLLSLIIACVSESSKDKAKGGEIQESVGGSAIPLGEIDSSKSDDENEITPIDRPEYHKLTCFDGVGYTRAHKLYDEGYETVEDVENMSMRELTRIDGIGRSTAEKIKGKKRRSKKIDLKGPNNRLKKQCSNLSIPFQEVEVNYSTEGYWVIDDQKFEDPAEAEKYRLGKESFNIKNWEGAHLKASVWQMYRRLQYVEWEWQFNNKEGLPSIYEVPSMYVKLLRNKYSKNEDEVLGGHYDEINERRIKKMIEHNEKSDILKNYRDFCARSGFDYDFMRLIYEILGKEKLKEIELKYCRNEELSGGWPDLTVIKSEDAEFIEVKTTDYLLKNQKQIIQKIAKPLDLNFKVHRLTVN